MSLYKHTNILVEPLISDKSLQPAKFNGGNEFKIPPPCICHHSWPSTRHIRIFILLRVEGLSRTLNASMHTL